MGLSAGSQFPKEVLTLQRAHETLQARVQRLLGVQSHLEGPGEEIQSESTGGGVSMRS